MVSIVYSFAVHLVGGMSPAGRQWCRRFICLGALAGIVVSGFTAPASAESLMDALAHAYRDNPELAAERARLRATDENLPQALAGWRPNLSADGSVARTHTKNDLSSGGSASSNLTTRDFSITLSQNLFAGFRTINSTKQAEALVAAGREALKNVEQNVLFDAVQAYMDVVRDIAVLKLRENNLKVLQEQLRASNDRFSVGEITRTDVAQSEASVAAAQSGVASAQAQLNSSRAVYEQVIGSPPNGVSSPGLPKGLIPISANQATAQGETYHPAIQAAIFAEQAASFQVDVTTGELLPTVDLQASLSRSYDPSSTLDRQDSAQVVGRLNVPIYQGGEVSSRVRQAKQTRAQRRLEIDLTRRQVRAAIIAAWGQLQAANSQIQSARANIESNNIALNGVREEARVGQRTVLDVLDAQQALLDAQVSLAAAERDRVVAAYALVSAVGKLNVDGLNLRVNRYDPFAHYLQVRNKWFGLTPPE